MKAMFRIRYICPLILLVLSVVLSFRSHKLGLGLTGVQEKGEQETGTTKSGFSFSIPTYTYFVLLVLQCGCQPLLVKIFMPTTVVRSTAVLGQEGAKLVISMASLALSGHWHEATSGWTLRDALMAAGVPAGLYVIQNYCNLMATQYLPPVTFVVLNQTKTLSTAWCCFLLMGQKQSNLQVIALMLLVFATLIIQNYVPLDPCEKACKKRSANVEDGADEEEPPYSKVEDDNEEAGLLRGTKSEEEEDEKDKEKGKREEAANDEAATQLTMGVLPALFASLISGLAGTLAQKTLQTFQRSPHLFNMELAVFSSSFLMLSLVAGSPDCHKLKEGGVSQGWTWKTWIPIVTNSCGGIFVGFVTKYQGAVVKGFAMIFGMVVSAILQQVFLSKQGGGVTKEQFVGGVIGALSLWMHASYPPNAA
jgi:UDP-sugar transporter A1/2/3